MSFIHLNDSTAWEWLELFSLCHAPYQEILSITEFNTYSILKSQLSMSLFDMSTQAEVDHPAEKGYRATPPTEVCMSARARVTWGTKTFLMLFD